MSEAGTNQLNQSRKFSVDGGLRISFFSRGKMKRLKNFMLSKWKSVSISNYYDLGYSFVLWLLIPKMCLNVVVDQCLNAVAKCI